MSPGCTLRELTGGLNPAERLITRDLRAAIHQPVDALAARVREYLQVTLQQQYAWLSAEDAFKNWRRAVEAVGVFVFKRAFKQEGISGFCLHDEMFPLVVVNKAQPTRSSPSLSSTSCAICSLPSVASPRTTTASS